MAVRVGWGGGLQGPVCVCGGVGGTRPAGPGRDEGLAAPVGVHTCEHTWVRCQHVSCRVVFVTAATCPAAHGVFSPLCHQSTHRNDTPVHVPKHPHAHAPQSTGFSQAALSAALTAALTYGVLDCVRVLAKESQVRCVWGCKDWYREV